MATRDREDDRIRIPKYLEKMSLEEIEELCKKYKEDLKKEPWYVEDENFDSTNFEEDDAM